MRLGLFGLLAAGIFAASTAYADMTVTTHDGRSFTVPVDVEHVRSIEFSGGGQAIPTGFGGSWKTTWGMMKLALSGAKIAGGYDSDDGLIKGEVKGDQLVGYWSENKSGQRCNTALDGRHYWGRLVFKLDATRSAFRGKWGYCHADPAASGQEDWTGLRQ